MKFSKIIMKGIRWTEADWRGIIALTLVIGAVFTLDKALLGLAGFAVGYYFRDKAKT